MREPPGFVWVWSLYTIPLGSLFATSFVLPMYYTLTFGFILFDMTMDKRIIGLLVFKSKCSLPDPYPISWNYVSQ